MATTLFLRDSTTNQLSSVGTVIGGAEGQTGGVAYRDALTTRGGASTTAVVNSTASGTNIQWTKTAGGALIEWISGYTPSGGFTLSGLVTVRVRGLESSMNNNVGLRIRLYKRKVNGDEDSLGPFDDGVELGTSDAAQDWTFTPSAMVFAEYDRLVIRIYATNIGTMAAGTNTISYDGPTSGAAGDSFVTITETVAFVTNVKLWTKYHLGRVKNALQWSQEFDHGFPWTTSNATIAGSSGTAPDGTNTAQLLTSTTSSASALLLQQAWTEPSGRADTQVYSIYVKQNSGPGWFSMSNSGNFAYWDIVNGVAGSTDDAGSTTSIADAGNGWWRCIWNLSPPTCFGGAIRLRIAQADGNANTLAIGNSLLIWGAQVEKGSTLTSYKQTTDTDWLEGPFAGEGTLTAVFVQPAVAHQLNASFAGVGALSANLQKTKLLAASFAGVGAMSADLRKGAKDLAASFAGTGSLTAALRQNMDVDAAFSGAGSLSADIRKAAITITATFSGIGGLSALVNQRMDLDASFGGIGSLSADAQIPAPSGVARDLAANFAGVGGLTVDLQKTKLLAASFAGAGALSADLDQAMVLSAALAGAGSLSADLRKAALALNATFAGSGGLTATMRQAMDLDAVLAGAGTMTADAQKGAISLSATFAGAGSLTASLGLVLPLRASFSGAGGLSVPTAVNQALFATFGGVGTMTASANVPGVVNNWDLAASFAGSGTLSATLRQRIAVAAVLAGSGTLSATFIRQVPLTPDADSSTGGWLNEANSTPLAPSLDEMVAIDSDYIQSSAAPTVDVCKISLSDPATGSLIAPVSVLYRYAKSGPDPADLQVRLLQGTTQISSWSHSGFGTSFVTAEQQLSGGEIATITDWSDLFLEFTSGSGWTQFTATEPSGEGSAFVGAGTRKIYVAAAGSGGSDSNPGTLASPKLTLDAGVALLRDGKPDWLLLKKGDTWTNQQFGDLAVSGVSAAAPILISAYGTGARPLVKTTTATNGVDSFADGGDYLAIVGIEFYAYTRDPSNPGFLSGAVSSDAQGVRLLFPIHWLLIEDCKFSFYHDNMTIQAPSVITGSTFRCRRNVIVDAYAISPDHSEGCYIESIDIPYFEENFWDHNGWNAIVSGAGATGFNRNLYIHQDCGPATVISDFYVHSSAEGMQLRTGGTMNNCFCIDNEYGGFDVGHQLDPDAAPSISSAIVNTNVVMNSGDQNGINISQCQTSGVQITGNIIINSPNDGIFMDPYGTANQTTGISVTGNIIFDAAGGINTSRCTGPNTTTPNQIDLNGDNVEFSYPDPTRTLASYAGTIGLTATSAAFYTAARAQSRDSWDPRLMASAAVAYIRAGFGL